MTSAFYFKDGTDNLFDEHDERAYDPTEGVFTEITDPDILPDIITNHTAKQEWLLTWLLESIVRLQCFMSFRNPSPPSEPELDIVTKKKRKGNSGKKQCTKKARI